MKNKIITPLFLLVVLSVNAIRLHAHDSHYEHALPRTWHMSDGSELKGFFYLSRGHETYIELTDGSVVHFPLSAFSDRDRKWIMEKNRAIDALHQEEIRSISAPENAASPASARSAGSEMATLIALVAAILTACYLVIRWAGLRAYHAIFGFMVVSVSSGLYSFARKGMRRAATITNPGFLDSAFAPFRPAVNTRWDNNYFYVDCKGIPAHSMMVGITSWQQQVPIPQCYIGINAWSIPLNPVNAVTPVPVNNKHFLRGAVALAVNGVPIFNPYTNTGVDAFLDGQLDNWGGHSGRADDYHYHIAPLFLEAKSGPVLPIAFALDGYAVYGSKEPDGSAMKTLDANHGHIGSDGRYHYHGSSSAPYMIGNMVGKVTEDTTLQIVPQPAAKGVRPALTPLKGAVITGFHPNGTNGYTLIYTLSGATDSIVYSWNTAGNFTYDFYTTSGKTTQNYTGKPLCEVPGAVKSVSAPALFDVYPNPAKDVLNIRLRANVHEGNITAMSLYNASGSLVRYRPGLQSSVNTAGLPAGFYWLKIEQGRQYSVVQVILK